MKATNDENEICRIANDITKPRNENDWKMKTEHGTTTDEKEIADIFNTCFTDKIEWGSE